ncbi:MAG: 4-amino-4-deoxy-L-arabinose transferase [Pseudozobellia sp.]|nr:4-amino-4-deoxy-L-arabinose transferase [Pseudozobellia sp.]MBG46873.1 4-amino-4-deoxy-L-arabinose transferase [Pseudozobellia sp.]|tara:strand:- start:1334 stop:2998 length:1665 start_codon:yes stop_codon:yes gene_type:complete
MKSSPSRKFLLLLGVIFVLNLIQSYTTPLIFDEAYYWHYAQNLSWGYFDHPPFVALMVKLGGLVFEGELGVRFVSCILSAAMMIVLWLCIDDDRKKNYEVHFFVLVFSMALLNAYGFFTLPDTPLLFFTALFLYVYKRFLEHGTWLWSLALGLTMAGLMYSKYHAALVIFFVLFSNLKLTLNKYAWGAVLVALACYVPHFIWLFDNDFVTIKYHLFDRPNDPYSFTKYTLGYFVNLIALFGLTFPWVYWSLFKTKNTDKFTKALLFLTYGIIIFFFVSSFNRRIQTQWIIVITIPLILLVFRQIMAHDSIRKWIFRTGIANGILILYLRVGLVYESISPIYYETHGNKEWVAQIKSEIGDMPVVFENSYRNAPMYQFYAHVPTYSLNNLMYRRNQYSIDDSESKVQHQKILYISRRPSNADLEFPKGDGKIYYGQFIDDFESFRKLETLIEEPVSLNFEQNQTFKVYNPYNEPIDLSKLKFNIAYLTPYKDVKDRMAIKVTPLEKNISSLPAKDTVSFSFQFPKPKMSDPTYFRIGISENGLIHGINGVNTKFE